ncbi:MAG: PPC domain-containing protein, partial [Ignisphaera sp.]|nr:PPC domain-containing protein [Ignisphaera sp.]
DTEDDAKATVLDYEDKYITCFPAQNMDLGAGNYAWKINYVDKLSLSTTTNHAVGSQDAYVQHSYIKTQNKIYAFMSHGDSVYSNGQYREVIIWARYHPLYLKDYAVNKTNLVGYGNEIYISTGNILHYSNDNGVTFINKGYETTNKALFPRRFRDLHYDNINTRFGITGYNSTNVSNYYSLVAGSVIDTKVIPSSTHVDIFRYYTDMIASPTNYIYSFELPPSDFQPWPIAYECVAQNMVNGSGSFLYSEDRILHNNGKYIIYSNTTPYMAVAETNNFVFTDLSGLPSDFSLTTTRNQQGNMASFSPSLTIKGQLENYHIQSSWLQVNNITPGAAGLVESTASNVPIDLSTYLSTNSFQTTVTALIQFYPAKAQTISEPFAGLATPTLTPTTTLVDNNIFRVDVLSDMDVDWITSDYAGTTIYNPILDYNKTDARNSYFVIDKGGIPQGETIQFAPIYGMFRGRKVLGPTTYTGIQATLSVSIASDLTAGLLTLSIDSNRKGDTGFTISIDGSAKVTKYYPWYENEYPYIFTVTTASYAIGTHIIEVIGEASLTIDTMQTDTKTLDFTGTMVPPPVITYGSTINANLSNSDLDGIDKSPAKTYQFYGVSGDSVTITMIATGNWDTYLYLYDSTFSGLTYDDDSAGGGNSRISTYVLPTTGIYYIQCCAYAGGRGDFALTLVKTN